jgi:dihydrofolate reductase
MSKLRCHISISLDGFVAGPNQSVENPLGEGGDGIESALKEAREAADGKDVMLWGGGQVAGQYLAAGLLDVLELHVVPVLPGGGSRLLDNLGDANVRLEQVRAVEAPGVTHLKYQVHHAA